ncbi:MAG: putative DNA-binding domain-containing protein [Proteobacteria bacterium]|nr:putative DNA-binding domain-containing protein [Pseudomonadota bacterium]
MRLESLQRDFAAALHDRTCTPTLLPSLLDPDGRAAERVALYRGNLVTAWRKALASAYPVLRAIVGTEFFDALAHVYGHAHPSVSGDLNHFGEHMPAFLADFAPAQSLPYLPEVAALEWLAHRAHYAADAISVSRNTIAALTPDALLDACFAVHPACTWLDSRFPLATIWRAHQLDADDVLPDQPSAGEIALVVRPYWRVDVVAAQPAEIAALAVLRRGEPLHMALAAALAIAPEFNLVQALPSWLDLHLLVSGHAVGSA